MIQQVECTFLCGKDMLIPTRVRTEPPRNEGEGAPRRNAEDPDVANDDEAYSQVFNMSSQNVQISPEACQMISSKFNLSEAEVGPLFIDAVNISFKEILPIVVDRTVGIARLTSRELVLKDFAQDGNPKKVLEAADKIMSNLAGSLAMVTCRDLLRVQLTTNSLKVIKQACLHAGTTTGLMKSEGSDAGEYTQSDQLLDNYMKENEQMLRYIAQGFTKDNLELSCRMIITAVIDRARRELRVDPVIKKAIEERKIANSKMFRDEKIIAQRSDLPHMLQPFPTGLTDAQF